MKQRRCGLSWLADIHKAMKGSGMLTMEAYDEVVERAERERRASEHLREQIDVAYDRGFQDGKEGSLAALVVGVISGGCTALIGVWVYGLIF